MRASVVLAGLFALALAGIATAQIQTLTVGGRTYSLPAATPVVIDGQPGTLSDLLDRPAGMQVRWQAQAGAVRGAVPTPIFSYTVIGPVTRAVPLEVLGQPVTITGDTVIEGFTDAGSLTLGAPMIIAGLVDPNGSVYATLAVRRDAQGNKFLVAGYVTELVTPQPRLRIGSQWIDTTGIAFADCTGGLPVAGDYVELRADSIAGFVPGDTIDTVAEARCASSVPPGTPGAQGFLDGIVGASISGASFELGALTITYSAATVFEFGGPDELDPGTEVSVEGTFTDATTLAADSVVFVRPPVRFEGPMVPGDVTPGQSLRPFGVTVNYSAQVRDDDGILAVGLTAPQQVQVRGWLDRNGAAFAARVRERGAPDPSDVALRGPVAAVDRPRFTVQGLGIDTTTATFSDADGAAMTADQFFAALRLNHVIDLGAASWNASTRTFSGGAITLLGFEHTQPIPGDPGAFVSGTARSYGVRELIFAAGFEPAPPR
ncbi:DUF5666 domain-containing protein [Tahibacter sp.]|uniref:DUF5666 domain-containing protein n=1 Tax=Tahibacter sp. TaxID=2056211 RepID=UPI0028C39D15|nr:DUF5666 domain-containing protein [Tahibacter sp.]